MNFARVFSNAPWEKKVGYCRALKAGNNIYVTGTAAIGDDGKPFAPGDAYAQARRCLELIEASLNQLGTDRTAVIRTRIFVTDITRWADFGKAHLEFFGQNPPVTSMVEVKSLIDPAFLVEIEADGVLDSY